MDNINPYAILKSTADRAIREFEEETGARPNALLTGQTELAVLIRENSLNNGQILDQSNPGQVFWKRMLILPSGEPSGVHSVLFRPSDLPKRKL